jgi:hexosaminidase
MKGIIPKIRSQKIGKGFFTLQSDLRIEGNINSKTLEIFLSRIKRIKGFEDFQISQKAKNSLAFAIDSSLKKEEYQIAVEEEKITIKASSDNGFSYALTTIYLLAFNGNGKIDCQEIEDQPNYEYRSFMLDICRHFMPFEETLKVLEQMALLKLNVFHFHFSEDQGYRIESKKFPKLNEIGSWRKETYGDKTPHGGYYTLEQVKQMVQFAADRFITVVPEIDMPGHTTAIIASYPELSCSQEPCEVGTRFGIFQRTLCPGKEVTYKFISDLLDEICPLFPGVYFHLGGDEAPKDEWKKCPDCQKVMKEQGFTDYSQLQGYFTNRVIKMLQVRGKRAIGWNEIAYSDNLEPGCMVQFWRGENAQDQEKVLKASQSHQLIMSNFFTFYFDYPFCVAPLKKTYSYQPKIEKKAVDRKCVIGVESPLWTEQVPTVDNLEYKVFPRLSVLAENAWSDDRKHFGNFKKRVVNNYIPLLNSYGLKQATIKEVSPAFFPRMIQIYQLLKKLKKIKKFYTSTPDKNQKS